MPSSFKRFFLAVILFLSPYAANAKGFSYFSSYSDYCKDTKVFLLNFGASLDIFFGSHDAGVDSGCLVSSQWILNLQSSLGIDTSKCNIRLKELQQGWYYGGNRSEQYASFEDLISYIDEIEKNDHLNKFAKANKIDPSSFKNKYALIDKLVSFVNLNETNFPNQPLFYVGHAQNCVKWGTEIQTKRNLSIEQKAAIATEAYRTGCYDYYSELATKLQPRHDNDYSLYFIKNLYHKMEDTDVSDSCLKLAELYVASYNKNNNKINNRSDLHKALLRHTEQPSFDKNEIGKRALHSANILFSVDKKLAKFFYNISCSKGNLNGCDGVIQSSIGENNEDIYRIMGELGRAIINKAKPPSEGYKIVCNFADNENEIAYDFTYIKNEFCSQNLNLKKSGN